MLRERPAAEGEGLEAGQRLPYPYRFVGGQLLGEQDEVSIAWLLLAHEVDEAARLGIVWAVVADEVGADEIDSHTRTGMLLHKVGRELRGVQGGVFGQQLPEIGHQLVVVRALHLHFAQVGSVGLDHHLAARLGEDRLLGIVGEDEDKRRRISHLRLIDEASSLNVDGVEAVDAPVRTIDQHLTLI